MLIRARRPADLPGCVEVLDKVHHRDGYPVNWPADPAGFLTSGAQLGAWVAERDGTVFGHVVLSDGRTEIDELAGLDVLPDKRFAGISRLFVAPAGQGGGLGRALLDTAVAAAAAAGREPILSVVDDGRDKAVSVYEHLGWRRIATLDADWTTSDGSVPMLRYYVAPSV